MHRAVVLGVITSLLIAGSANASCSSPYTRPEWSTLSQSQKALYITALKVLANRPQSRQGVVSDPSSISLLDFTNLHARASPWAHGSAEFYPYHRAMMWKFEQAMQSAGWIGGVPYWDWPAMNTNWWSSDLFTASYIGEAKSSSASYCVTQGQFGQSSYHVAVLDPDVTSYANGLHQGSSPQCLIRCGEVGSAATYPDEINSRYSATTYADFRGDSHSDDDFTGYHASGHEIVGGYSACNGDMANPSISPNDPAFWLHHGLVDKIWWRWQTRCAAFLTDYEGPLTSYDPIDPTGSDVAVSTQAVDTWQVSVASVLNTQGDLLCYTYASSGSDLSMPAITCPAASSSSSGSSTTGSSGSGSSGSGSSTVSANSGSGSASSSGSGSGSGSVATATGGSDASATGSATIATTASSSDISDWVTPMIVGFVARKISFNTGHRRDNNSDSSVDADASISVISTRTDKHYIAITQADNSTLIIFNNAEGKNVTVPADQTIRFVYRSYVETLNNGTLTRLYPYNEYKPYVHVDGAPVNVTTGDPCYRAYTLPMSDRWIKMHQLDWAKVRNSEARAMERIDRWNIENCGPVSS
ncbi:hypothetical protein HDU82_001507 [Entophlyctis luteolus]|nr:hypothetical protein HDU82_001507 [Entophlyctis luteolus]